MAEIGSGKLAGKDGRRRWWWCSDVDGGGAPAISRRGEVDDDARIFAAVKKISSVTSPSSQNSGYERMDVVFSGDAPARSYGKSGTLKRE
jgi:hypothetical protein